MIFSIDYVSMYFDVIDDKKCGYLQLPQRRVEFIFRQKKYA